MAIFTAIGTAIAGALFAGSALAATIISGVLAFGTQLAIKYLTRKRTNDAGRTFSAVKGEVSFGGDVPADTLFGAGKVGGHRIFYAKWGAGNQINAEVFVLANGWCDGLELEVYFYGEKYTLLEEDTIGNETARYSVVGFFDLIWIRFYDGRPDQGVDEKLVEDTADLGRNWKSTSVAAGMCYVVVERRWDAEKFDKGRPAFEWVLRGLREYDPRKDSTVAGGSGSHRLNNPATWEHTYNPAVHRFNYQIGLKGLISGRSLIGEGKSIGQLDLGSYMASMNACDALRDDGKKTYQCSLYVTAEDDHTQVLREFDDAMCGYGLNRRGLSGVIAGAPQIPVAEITDDDISLDRPKQTKYRKRAFELYNTISGQFTSPESQWRPESLNTVRVNADVTADGRVRQTSNDFLQITDPDIAQYCLNVRYRQNRKGGSATVPVSRRMGFQVQEGEWITYKGKDWLITGWSCDAKLRIKLTLAETGADIYDDEDIDPGPIVVPPTPPVNPSLLSTVQNFDVEAGIIEGADGIQTPCLRFTWDPPGDPTITGVRFFYLVGGEPSEGTFEDWTENPEAGEYVTTKNVTSGVFYTCRATIRTRPDRFKIFTPWKTTETITDNLTVDYDTIREKVQESIDAALDWLDEESPIFGLGQGLAARLLDAQQLSQSMRDLADDVGRVALRVGNQFLIGQTNYTAISGAVAEVNQALTSRINVTDEGVAINAAAITSLLLSLDNYATVEATDALLAAIVENADGVSLNASAVTALRTQLGNEGASIIWKMETGYTPSAGWDLRAGIKLALEAGGTLYEMGDFWELKDDGTSRRLILAEEFIVTNGTESAAPLVFSDDELIVNAARLNVADIGMVTAGTLQSPDSKFVIDLANAEITIFV